MRQRRKVKLRASRSSGFEDIADSTDSLDQLQGKILVHLRGGCENTLAVMLGGDQNEKEQTTKNYDDTRN